MTKYGVIGLGFVGGSIFKSFKEKGLDVVGYDKYKNGGIGYFKKMLGCDILFLCLPTPFNYSTKEYDLNCFHDVLNELLKNDYKGLIVIKSTVEPGTCKKFVIKYNLGIIHNPEFLTARTAYEDFHNQKHIVIGTTAYYNNHLFIDLVEMYKKNYTKNISIVCSCESESMKLCCNSFYAAKIMFFNEIYLLSQKLGVKYKNIRDLMLRNEWINPMHTNVPGPDGSLGYGGACFPKDTNALLHFYKKNNLPCYLLEGCVNGNNNLRDEDKPWFKINLNETI